MTSNVGSEISREYSNLGFAGMNEGARVEEQAIEEYKEKIGEALRDTFRPEFLNRIDETIVFNPLTPKDIEAIVDIQLEELKERLTDKNIKLAVEPAARKYLAEHGFSPEFGARPLKRLIQKVILDKLADRIIRGEFKHGGKVKVNFKEGALVFSA